MYSTAMARNFEMLYGRRVTYHSQPETEQDRWVLKTLRGKERGTFLEIGAYDGVFHSNTLCLERDFGWTGWLIEAVSDYAARASRVRRAPVINCAIGPEDSGQPFYVSEQWSGLVNYTRENLVAGHVTHQSPVVTVRTLPLSTLVHDLRMPPIVDYLSLDVEGAEFPILEAYFNPPTGRPTTFFRCMTIEVGIYADQIQELCALLEPLGYRLDNIRAWDAYFIHPSLI